VNTLLTEWERSNSDDIKDSIEESEKMCAGGVVDVASSNDVENGISCSEPKDGE